MLNTYGHKMQGIKQAAGDCSKLCPYYFAHDSVEIFYNPAAGRVYSVYHTGDGWELWGRAPAEFELVTEVTTPQSMQDIADAIAEYLQGGEL